jgi:hypothetical protein
MPPQPDVFLSYNSLDRTQVDAVRTEMERLGLTTFIDHASLAAGLPWPEALEKALKDVHAVAVFLGANGLGRWQRREVFLALEMQDVARGEGRQLPVVPVLLPGADRTPSFLLENTWIELRDDPAGVGRSLADTIASRPRARIAVAPSTVTPYVGLRAFSEENSAFFFGRNAVVDQLVERVRRGKVIAVVGASGSGKSSVVFGGLVPRLRRWRRPDPTWEICAFTPGAHPWRRLADALALFLEPDDKAATTRLAAELATDLDRGGGALESAVERVIRASGGSTRLLLVVDQFEELFRQVPLPKQAEFVDRLFCAAETSPLTALITLRADFVAPALQCDRRLANAIGQCNVHLGPLTREDLAATIEGPLRLVGASLEPGLLNKLLVDVERAPGQLALLEYALDDLWQRASLDKTDVRDVVFTHAAYSPLEKAIASRAEQLYASLDPAECAHVRRLFRRLVLVSKGGGAGDTRRRARRSELSAEAWTVALRFAEPEYRLLVIAESNAAEEPTAEVAHEAILEHWARLKRWIDDDRAAIVLEQKVADARLAWEEHGRAEEYLLEGPSLTAAGEWALREGAEPDAATADFLLRAFVRSGDSLEPWVALYCRTADSVAFASSLMQADESHRLRALDVLRWSPETGAAATVVARAVGDDSAAVRRYAAMVLFARGEGAALRKVATNRGDSPEKRKRALDGIAQARNVRGIGRRAYDGLPSSLRRRAALRSLVDLFSLNRTPIALSFAISSVATALMWTLADRLLTTLGDALISMEDHINLYPFTGSGLDFVAAGGCAALIRSIIDGKTLRRSSLAYVGFVTGALTQLISIVERLVEDVVLSALRPSWSRMNFVLAFTDNLPTILAMAVFGAGLLQVARPRMKLGSSVVVALAAALLSSGPRTLIGVSIGLFHGTEVRTIVVQTVLDMTLALIISITWLYALRFALRIAFESKPFPDWPVPTAPWPLAPVETMNREQAPTRTSANIGAPAGGAGRAEASSST